MTIKSDTLFELQRAMDEKVPPNGNISSKLPILESRKWNDAPIMLLKSIPRVIVIKSSLAAIA
jgi:hypothetical protein